MSKFVKIPDPVWRPHPAPSAPARGRFLVTSQLLTRPGLGANLGLRVHPLLRNQTLLAALILTAVLGVFYHDVIFEGRTFLMESIVSGVTVNDGLAVAVVVGVAAGGCQLPVQSP